MFCLYSTFHSIAYDPELDLISAVFAKRPCYTVLLGIAGIGYAAEQ
jgi:hypothetical protein